MGYEDNTGLGVNNHYGPRETGAFNGELPSKGRERELVMDINGAAVTNGGALLDDAILPAGADITRVYVCVTTAATSWGNADNVVDVGTDTTEATNGFTMTDTIMDTVATTDMTSELSGTWAAPLAAATTVGFAVSGTTAAMVGGEAKLIIKYNITKFA
jgi:hypothetical protein